MGLVAAQTLSAGADGTVSGTCDRSSQDE
jgi:hypothetical protein